MLMGAISIWFNDPTRLATFLGLVTAGVAFALQKPISALAGYLVILRGKTFNVGDRITMGGVRGDVIALRFTQTTVMEMGQPPDVQNAEPAVWVEARQYTGRIVTISNSTVFDEPVFNYTEGIPSMLLGGNASSRFLQRRPAPRRTNSSGHRRTPHRKNTRAKRNCLIRIATPLFLSAGDLHPRVFWRLTDNWLEMTVRFIATTHNIRKLKDAMSRDILTALDRANIGIASSTYDIVGMPPIQVQLNSQPNRQPNHEPADQIAPARRSAEIPG